MKKINIPEELKFTATIILIIVLIFVLFINIVRSMDGCHGVVYFDYVTLGLTRLACEVK